MQTRIEGYYNFLDVDHLRTIVKRADDQQLQFFLNVATKQGLSEQRLVVLGEMGNRVLSVYQKSMRH